MKRTSRQKQVRIAQAAFLRGLMATGIVSIAESKGMSISRKQLRRAVKSGIAVSSGTLFADALLGNRPGSAVLALVTGVAGVMVLDRLLVGAEDNMERITDGQEEIA